MRMRTLLLSLAIFSMYVQYGPYKGFTEQQMQDSDVIAQTVFADYGFQAEARSFSGFVPLNLPTDPSVRVVHEGIQLEPRDNELELYSTELAQRAQNNKYFTTNVTQDDIDSGCRSATSYPTYCRYDFFAETAENVYEVTLEVTEPKRAMFRSEMTIVPVRPAH